MTTRGTRNQTKTTFMGRIGKISVIPKDFDGAFPTMEKSLRQRGMSRAPGTTKMMLPSKELNGKYRTGLDENAKYILRIEDPMIKKLEQEKIIALRKKLEYDTGIDLSPTSQYYNYTSKQPGPHAEPVKLVDGDNLFNLDDPWQHITYLWLSADPRVASSLAAYERGEYPHDIQYYVNDEDVESALQYRKKKTANDAIIKFDSWSLEKRRKVARLLDLPVSENTREELVYNLVDSLLKSQQISSGVHKGKDPIKVFALYADLKDDLLYVRDLVEQAFKHQIYKEKKGGRIYEGELEVYRDKQELIDHLIDDDNQEDLLELEKKLKVKKLAHV
jgi:hypothetical protein